MKHSKQQIKSGFIWSTLDSFGNQAIGLVISLTLANLLGPSDYDLVGMLTIFIAIANVFVNSGFGSALIRKVNRNEKDFSTTFYFSLTISILGYLILFVCAPLIAKFYAQPDLTTLTRVIALTIIINTFAIIPRTKLSVTLSFKSLAKANITALLISGTVALTMALNGFGVWTLVIQQLVSTIITVFMLNLLSPWKPVEKFCKKAFKELFGFGSKLLASGLLDTIYNNLYGLIIGKQFSATELGLFNQANTLSSMPAMTITGVIQKVTYPMLSAMQEDTAKLDKVYLLTLQLASLIVFPVMFGISIIAKPLIALLLGSQWQGSAELISILTLGLMLYPIHAINLNMLQVKGRSDIFLKLEVIKKVIVTIALVVSVPFGVKAICIGMVVTSFLSMFVNTYYTGKLSSLSQIKQLAALMPIMFISMISAGLGCVIGSYFTTHIIIITVTLVSALIIYVLFLIATQRVLLIQILKLIKGS